jgi:hypothetical protein
MHVSGARPDSLQKNEDPLGWNFHSRISVQAVKASISDLIVIVITQQQATFEADLRTRTSSTRRV